MKFLFDKEIKDKISITNEVPYDYEDYCISFDNVIFIEGSCGSILSQWVKRKDYQLWSHHFFIKQPIRIYPFTEKPIITLHYLLNGQIDCILKGVGKVRLKENFCNFFYVPSTRHEAYLLPGHYSSFHINFTLQYIVRFAGRNEILDDLLRQSMLHSIDGFKHQEINFDAATTILIMDVLTCNMQGVQRNLFFRSKILQLLLTYVRNATVLQQRIPDTISLEKITAYITENIGKDLSIALLAKKAGMSQSNLRRQFIKKYRCTLHEFIFEARMNHAMEKITTTNIQVGHIAYMVGYSEFSSFTHAFTKYFGRPPHSFRD